MAAKWLTSCIFQMLALPLPSSHTNDADPRRMLRTAVQERMVVLGGRAERKAFIYCWLVRYLPPNLTISSPTGSIQGNLSATVIRQTHLASFVYRNLCHRSTLYVRLRVCGGVWLGGSLLAK
jgi:hypothetical protein